MTATPARLLVVDDNEDNRETLARRLRRRGFEVGLAADGYQALDAIGREAYDLVLLDVQMPGLSGFDVLKQLRIDHAPTRLPVIIATARTDREDIVEALNLGANDYVTKPLDFPVVLARVETQLAHKKAVDRILSLEADLRRQNEELEANNRRMRRSLELAADMQRALLPSGPLGAPGVRYAFAYHPCDELGGDILNIFPIGPRHVGLYLLDVSGHGVPAALLSVTLSRMLQARPDQSSLVARAGEAGLEPRGPVEVATELNRRFPMDDHLEQYFTVLYGVLDLDTGLLRCVSAGHPPVLYLPANGPSRFLLDSSGFAIGWLPDSHYQELELPLAPGDRLLVYSDGIIEAANDATQTFGRDRLGQACERSREASLDSLLECIVHAAQEFRGPAPALDDVSAMVIEWTPNDAPVPRTTPGATLPREYRGRE
ncbi:MAG TPA: SpoIIE family protein phosphatase [Tepidisphaeraceae bacterium]